MFESFKTHWRSTVVGILGAALGAFATTANLDKMTAGQALLAFGGCVWMAVQGYVAADAKKVPPADDAKVN